MNKLYRDSILIVHGGAGERKPKKKVLDKLSESLLSGFEILKNGGNAIDAVVKSIRILEDSGLFNAGLGGNLQLDGVRRLDASLMDGKDLRAGAVIGLQGIKNPIIAAKVVMGLPHVILTNVGAKRIAKAHKLERLSNPSDECLVLLAEIKKKQKDIADIYERYFSTVGAIAFDINGNLSAGTSTGGITAMLPGRVGDTPIIGAGTYADNSFGAVSCTGTGEEIIRLAMAKEICMNMKKLSPFKAVELSLRNLQRIGGKGGVIAINKKGEFAIVHSTKYMAAGYAKKKSINIQIQW